MKARLCGIVALISLFTAGCATTGVIQARLEIPGQAAATPVKMDFRSERFGPGGTLTVGLPSGETFKGRYLQVTSAVSGDTLGTPWGGWGVWGPYWSDWGAYGSAWVGGGDYETFIQNYSGKVISTLFGSRGDTMRCRFRLAAPVEGMEGGGVGECQTSGGDKIEAQF